MKKKFLFWRDVNITTRQECVIEAKDLDEAMELHNDICDYITVDTCDDYEILNEGIQEIKKKEIA